MRPAAALACVGLLAMAVARAASPTPGTSADETQCSAVAVARVPPSLVSLRITNANLVDSTTATPATGEARPGQLFCRVRGIIEQETGFELWLPLPGRWNGRFMGIGVGGEAGTLNEKDMARALGRGYATASTDAGHKLGDANWAWRRADRRANFAARANHLLALASKELVRLFYGVRPAHAYFAGCSGGGREGLKESQSYPEDYDGILAGSAGPDQFAASLRLLWMQYIQEPSHRGLMGARDWALVSRKMTDACDVRDGVADGVIEDPRSCQFDWSQLQCATPGAVECLTAAQVEYARKLFAPLSDGSGAAVDQGLAAGVPLRFEPRSAFAFTLFGLVVHDDPDWDPMTLDIAGDLAAARERWPELPNDNADLGPFAGRGGHIIYYHGWSDPFLPALSALAYWDHVREQMGAASDKAVRVFMVPGLGHCNGGPGPEQFGALGQGVPDSSADSDMLSALEAWVEQGRAPDRIIASRTLPDGTLRTRALCAYPAVAAYDGKGPTDFAGSFTCRLP